jgi:hypothetical protein
MKSFNIFLSENINNVKKTKIQKTINNFNNFKIFENKEQAEKILKIKNISKSNTEYIKLKDTCKKLFGNYNYLGLVIHYNMIIMKI